MKKLASLHYNKMCVVPYDMYHRTDLYPLCIVFRNVVNIVSLPPSFKYLLKTEIFIIKTYHFDVYIMYMQSFVVSSSFISYISLDEDSVLEPFNTQFSKYEGPEYIHCFRMIPGVTVIAVCNLWI